MIGSVVSVVMPLIVKRFLAQVNPVELERHTNSARRARTAHIPLGDMLLWSAGVASMKLLPRSRAVAKSGAGWMARNRL